MSTTLKEATYLALLARAYLAAPAHSDEETVIEQALNLACARLRTDPADLVEDFT